MPYITAKERNDIGILTELPNLETPGQLNYFLTTVIVEYLEEKRFKPDLQDNNYADYNEVIGVLECIKQEFYRRMVIPYENKKMEEHGDVY